MRFNEIIDPLYGKIQFPSFINQLLLCPELLRLKEIRMSNINFFKFTGFSDSSRYEHSVGTAFLASVLTKKWDINIKDGLELITAALFHDIATPPFGHGTEIVFNEIFGFDHEEETAKIILGQTSEFRKTDIGPIYAGEVPKLRKIFEKTTNPKLDIKNVYLYTQGKGKFGKIIKGKIDLDNIDNVIRSAYHIGLQIDKNLPYDLAKSFIYDRSGNISFDYHNKYRINKWLEVRNDLYTHLLLNTVDLNRELMLKYAIKKAIEFKIMKKTDWIWTDNQLINNLTEPKEKNDKYEELRELINRVRLGIYFTEIGLYWISDSELYCKLMDGNHISSKIGNELSKLFKTNVVVNVVPDKRSRLIDDFRLVVEEPLFQSLLPEKEKITTFGKELKNVLLCIYSVQPTIVKREDGQGKAKLDGTGKQIKYKLSELRTLTLDYLKKILGNANNISIFHPKMIKTK